MRARWAVFAFLWFGIWMLLMPWKVFAAGDEEQTVKIGYYQSRLFQEGDGETSMRSGYGYEYMQKLASYTGWRYEYVSGTWQELYQKLVSGKIDLMSGISLEKGRTDEISYPDYEMLEETFYIYKDSDDSSIRSGDIASFSGKRIGAVEDPKMEAALDAWIGESGADVNVIQ